MKIANKKYFVQMLLFSVVVLMLTTPALAQKNPANKTAEKNADGHYYSRHPAPLYTNLSEVGSI